MSATTNAPQVYGGDEVGAVVLDAGSFSTRAGYAGEDSPRYVIPSYYGYNEQKKGDLVEDTALDYASITYKTNYKRREYTYFGDESIHVPRSQTQIKPIIHDEIIEDWDAAIEMFDYLFNNLNADIEEQPVFMTEPVWNTKVNKLKSLEVFLEFFKTPGFYLGKAPSCTAFAAGRPNSLIVDIGHNVTSVTPVLDGMCLSKNTMKTHYGGGFLDAQLRCSFMQRGIDLIPRFQINSRTFTKYSLEQLQAKQKVEPQFQTSSLVPENITESFKEFENQRIYNEMKESLIVVPETPISDSSKFDYQSRYFELPNGLQVEFGDERYNIANSLFEPTNFINFWKKHPEYHHDDDFDWSTGENGELDELDINNDYVPLKRGKKKEDTAEYSEGGPVASDGTGTNNNNKPSNSSAASKNAKVAGLSSLINKTISALDVDIRQQVAHNIVVTGATSLVPGLTDRLFKDLGDTNPGLKIRIHASGNTSERKYQNWIGGSILSSLGIFHQLWVSKQEYEEVGGERLITERFR
ncbi:Arp4 protein [Saccharomycopsis crataegensis]|uniref:Arp4 protein n=1 Tax=Saccharomycopsis crataegensis TaxID=43959 RepID=A0AAV5QEQ5_9ASCO|nr:Arp4 protein [Saccharomycopsis crataegensis]